MGRQIIFHMLPQDFVMFLRFVQQRDPVVVTEFTADIGDVHPLDLKGNAALHKRWLCLWNKELLPTLKRIYIPESAHGPYYRVDSSLPVLELSVPLQTVWDQRRALTQGRLYAYAYQTHPSLRTGYEALVRWIRKNFKKNPIDWMSGYTGPAAHEWYQNGGLLLPTVQPPVNSEWLARINAQHPAH
jgi:hypothetical protein